MDRFLNFELLANPANWLIVAMMVWLGAFGLRLVIKSGQSEHPFGLL